ncbi:MAG TPA: hypothetical protein VIA62_17360 [Thermoanaerobaculia bacterium]|nr:hypothetical protein [Thermoanaerobaculia bacterium]
MRDVILQPVFRDQVEELAAGRLRHAEGRRIVRQLLARAAQSPEPVLPGRLLVPPVAEGSYEKALDRAFERVCRLHERLGGKNPCVGIDTPMELTASYSASVPSGRRA